MTSIRDIFSYKSVGLGFGVGLAAVFTGLAYMSGAQEPVITTGLSLLAAASATGGVVDACQQYTGKADNTSFVHNSSEDIYLYTPFDPH